MVLDVLYWTFTHHYNLFKRGDRLFLFLYAITHSSTALETVSKVLCQNIVWSCNVYVCQILCFEFMCLLSFFFRADHSSLAHRPVHKFKLFIVTLYILHVYLSNSNKVHIHTTWNKIIIMKKYIVSHIIVCWFCTTVDSCESFKSLSI